MLSVPGAYSARTCIFCRFRSIQLSLQKHRLRHTQHDAPSTHNRRIRYTSESNRKNPFLDRRGGKASKFQAPRNNGFVPIKQPYLTSFQAKLDTRLETVKQELQRSLTVEKLLKQKTQSEDKQRTFGKEWKLFLANLKQSRNDPEPSQPSMGASEGNPGSATLYEELKAAFEARGQNGLDDRIKFAFYGHLLGSEFTKNEIKNQQALADLRYPTEWYPATRLIPRQIHLHVGPTNSGKTYHALQRLEQAQSGIYAGPLRLLAHEVYTRLNAKGRSCSLITGEERRPPSEETDRDLGDLSSCTVEMVPLNMNIDVAVIDEIQMLGNSERGWAWTQALMGVKAYEVHLCGEERTIPLITEICASLGEKLHIHRYQRLTPLKLDPEGSLRGNLKRLRRGDCIVSFSVMGIHSLRRSIERITGRKVATVYGSLPPETRAQQARLFNDPNNDYDFLVASDAVGMGLNLAIKRIIFESSSKFDGAALRTLSIADIKQIAGRAGRYRVAQPIPQKEASSEQMGRPADHVTEARTDYTNADSTGLVTTLENFDFPVIASAMEEQPELLRTAGLFPPDAILEKFAAYFPAGTPFSYILTRLHEISSTNRRFHLCVLKDHIWIADLIEPVEGLSITDRNIICSSPAGKTDIELWTKLLPAYARCIAEQKESTVIDIEELPLEILEEEVSASREYLRGLERLHKGLVSYLWLSYRFAGIFTARALAFHVKLMVESKIEEVLGQFSFTEEQRRKAAASREKRLLRSISESLETQQQRSPVSDASDPETTSDPVDARGYPMAPQRQTSLTLGGDRKSGEDEDLGLSNDIENPPIEDDAYSSTSGFPKRRPDMVESAFTPPTGRSDPEEHSLHSPSGRKHVPDLDVKATGMARTLASRL